MTPTLLNNRYRVLQTLGSGGFGNTFLAEDTYMPSARRCVIKQLKPVTHDPQAYEMVKERFQREAAVLEDLGEGNKQIPRLFAYFSEAGQFYLVQEWIQGDTLSNKVERGGLVSESEVKQILVSLLPVLDYVHSRRMVHRDIKPDNVIIRQQDGLPVLIDFGAVKEAMNTPDNSVQSMVIGTPGYMPSEQAAGRPTYASDLYSLGLTAVFLLTSKTPQELETDARTGEFLWRQYAPTIQSDLAMVIERAIRFTPRDRFATAKEMLDALQSPTNAPAVTPHAPSEMATVAVSPGGLPPAGNRSTPPIANSYPPQTVPVGTDPARQGNGNKPLIIGAVILGALLAAGAIGIGLIRSLQPSSPVVSDSAPSSRDPTTQPPSSPIAVSPSVQPSDAQPASELPPTQPPLSPTPASSQPVEITPSPVLPESPSQPAAPAPTPAPTASSGPAVQFPSPTSGSNNQNPNLSRKVPGFAPGTQRSAVEYELGKPTKVSNGLWNTRAVLYEEFVPGQVSLGYLFDRTSGRLRQSEASFAPSADLETMSSALNKMLSNNASSDIQQGLANIYQRQSLRYPFVSGRGNRLKGVIERNSSDRIYIGVWEADLH